MTTTPEEQILRTAAHRLTEPDAADAAGRAAPELAAWLEASATRLRRDLPSWRVRIDAGLSRRTVAELVDLVYGPALATARAVLSGPLPVYTQAEKRAIADRDAEITRLREALHSARAAVAEGQPAEAVVASIARTLGDGDGPRYLNSRMRARFRKAAEVCRKAAYLTRAEARQAVAEVAERYGRQQRHYLCPHCRLWHLTSQLRDAEQLVEQP